MRWMWEYIILRTLSVLVWVSQYITTLVNRWGNLRRIHWTLRNFGCRQSALVFSYSANWRLITDIKITINFWFALKYSSVHWSRVTPSYITLDKWQLFSVLNQSSIITFTFRDLDEEHFPTGVNTIPAIWSHGILITMHGRAIWLLIRVPRGKITASIDGFRGYIPKQSQDLPH